MANLRCGATSTKFGLADTELALRGQSPERLGVRVKLQALLNAAKHIEASRGRDALARVLAESSEAVQAQVKTGIAINWHPYEELIEFLEVAERTIGSGDGELCKELGVAGAKVNLGNPIVRAAKYIAKPEFLMRRVAGLWSRFNSEGKMRVVAVNENDALIELLDIPEPHYLLCCTITGWSKELAEEFYTRSPESEHVECRARGASRCLWHVSWAETL